LNRVLDKVEPACKAGRISCFEPGIFPLFGWIDELLSVDVCLSFRFSLCFISFHLSLVVGNASNSQESVLLQGPQKTQMLAFKEFEPERNVMAEFDAE
jgi:hypothetical protein